MISEKLKSVIFDKLYQDLKHCEIIPYDGSIYIIARDNKFWYFEYDKGGTLWWRYDFFNTFFELFSLTYNAGKTRISTRSVSPEFFFCQRSPKGRVSRKKAIEG